jgi:glycosyltransferase involved in cell wall biosynthesis
VLEIDMASPAAPEGSAGCLRGEAGTPLDEGGQNGHPQPRLPIRLGVYTDMTYRSDGDAVYAGRAFVRFVTGLPPRVAQVVLLGRLDPTPARSHYRLPSTDVEFVALPHYPRVSSIWRMLRSVRASCRAFRHELERLDAVWIFGPHPMAVLFAWLARRHRKPLILGVRQHYPRYIAGRLPGARWLWALPVAHALDAAFRYLGRQAPTIAVGDELARRYAGGAPVLATGFSLVRRSEVVSPAQALAKRWSGELRLLSVTRLDPEKNPLLLVETLAKLRVRDPRWRLVIAGDGPMRGQLLDEIERRRLNDVIEVRGEVSNGPELWGLYRSCHAFLHVSLTEGVPQVLFEAQAAGLPIVATDVGGVRAALAAGGAGLLIQPRDPEAAVTALRRLANEPSLRRRLIEAALEQIQTQTLEAQLDRIALFMGQNVS